MDTWAQGDSYELYMGRWSSHVGRAFSRWVGVRPAARWLDVGCGTGALSQVIADECQPSEVWAVDASPGFVDSARRRLGKAVDVTVADAQDLPFPTGSFDAAVSGLCLNFVPDPAKAVSEMQRVTSGGGTAAAYLWDYAEGMEMIRRFWDVAIDLDSSATHLDEAIRFPLCEREALGSLFTGAGLAHVETTALEIPTTFVDFDDFWRPFLGGQGPAPTYVASLTIEARSRLESALRAALPTSADGGVALTARAWAVKGTA